MLNLLTETRKLGAKPCNAPMTPNMHLTGDGELFEDLERYQRLVGKLNYLTMTRLDIAYSVSVVSQFMSSPIVHHWAALEQILCYLNEHPNGVSYMQIMRTLILNVFQMQIGQVPKWIEDSLQVIVSLLKEI